VKASVGLVILLIVLGVSSLAQSPVLPPESAAAVWPAEGSWSAGMIDPTTQTAVSQVSLPPHSDAVQHSGPLLPVRGLYVQFERRGWASGYWPGQVISDLNSFDDVVGHTVADEVALQLDVMRQMGVNAIAYELRASDPTWIPGPLEPPECNIGPALGVQWPLPTPEEMTNLVAFLDLVHSRGMKVFLRLTNTHMEEQPPTNNATWIGTILNAIKDHPALDLILFEGNIHVFDWDGDGIGDDCGIPAEPPLWLGPTSVPAQYVGWAIGYAHSLGLPYRQLSAQAVIGDFFVESEPPAGRYATDGHLWSPIYVLKSILDDLSVPHGQRTYAVSFYERRKCSTAQGLPCVDADPHTWGDETLQGVYDTVGIGNGARVVAVEMGIKVPVEADWSTEQALESLVSLMREHRVDGGCFWRWTSFSNDEDLDPALGSPVKQRGEAFVYNPVKDVLVRLYSNRVYLPVVWRGG
jgi:hypothetical protein